MCAKGPTELAIGGRPRTLFGFAVGITTAFEYWIRILACTAHTIDVETRFVFRRSRGPCKLSLERERDAAIAGAGFIGDAARLVQELVPEPMLVLLLLASNGIMVTNRDLDLGFLVLTSRMRVWDRLR